MANRHTIGEITKKEDGDVVLRLPSTKAGSYSSLFINGASLRLGSNVWHGGFGHGSTVVGNINDLLLDIGQQALTWPEQPKQRLVRVREMPKTGQFVAMWINNGKPWSDVLRWNTGELLEKCNDSGDKWAPLSSSDNVLEHAMFFIYSSEET